MEKYTFQIIDEFAKNGRCKKEILLQKYNLRYSQALAEMKNNQHLMKKNVLLKIERQV